MTDRPDLYQLRDAMLALDFAERENLKSMLDREEQRVAILPSREEDELWQALVNITPNGQRNYRSFSEFVRDKRHGVNRAAFNAAGEIIYDLIAQTKIVRHQVNDRVALLELLLACLAKDMRYRRVEINPKTLLEAMPRLRIATENCYPGYIDAGMLHCLIRVAEPA
jgi:hypothetical protein